MKSHHRQDISERFNRTLRSMYNNYWDTEEALVEADIKNQREYLKLDQHIRDYEPQISLTDNNEGLDFYNFFSKNLAKNLNPKGKIILEIGYKKKHKIIKNLFVKNNFKHKWHKDLNGDNRVIELYQ